jgi:hypothetical protein|tara:strand:+ start:1928 stop:2149 length:222 start_codon:yes stop_codon:yes gene_type:complete
MGSNSTQRAITTYISAPGSKGTTKAVGQVVQQMGMKQFNSSQSQNQNQSKHYRGKNMINDNAGSQTKSQSIIL